MSKLVTELLRSKLDYYKDHCRQVRGYGPHDAMESVKKIEELIALVESLAAEMELLRE